MADEIKIKVPDIGGATDIDVIEILVKPGDEIHKDASLITLESDKASMDIPSPQAGKIANILVKVGDKVSEGDVILTLLGEQQSHRAPKVEPVSESPQTERKEPVATSKNTEKQTEHLEVRVPDIGGATDVDVIEVMVSMGQAIAREQSLITLEGDKATMDIPSPAAGIVREIALKVGDKVSQGSLVLILETEQNESMSPVSINAEKQSTVPQKEQTPLKEKTPLLKNESKVDNQDIVSAGPAVRRMARELGVNLAEVKGTGRKGRITKEDIQKFVKTKLNEKAAGAFTLPTAPMIDFSKFGPIETKPLNKIKRLTGANVHRSWITIPHVTQFDEADITNLEAFRKSETDNAIKEGYKLTILAFVTKVVAKALAVYPQFNASLDANGDNLIYKQYFNIGIAVETPNGLVVPVIKQVDKLSVKEIALEMANLSAKAREKGLMPADMSGGSFTISSLGGIGGTAFTPIVNSPEVAILGLSRSSMKPVYDKGELRPRLMLPLSLSYDHRVIDGAEAARFTRYIAESLSDIRRILL